MGLEFNKLRSEEGRTQAWRTFQRRLNENFGLLSLLMSPKDLTELSMKIENDIHSEGTAGEGSPLEEVKKFLGGPETARKQLGRPPKHSIN